MKKLNEEYEQHLRKTFKRIQDTIDELTNDTSLYAIKVRSLESDLYRVRAQRDEANDRVISLETNLNIQQNNTKIAYDEVNRLRDIIQDFSQSFSQSSVEVLNDD